jgi:hypothetical protein
MDAYELRDEYKKRCPEKHYFDIETLKFFGDTMKNYGVRQAFVTVKGDQMAT